MPINFKIKNVTYANIKNLVKMEQIKTLWREKFETAPTLKKLNRTESTTVLTRTMLRNLLFNN